MYYCPSSKFNNLVNEADIQAALAGLASQEYPSYTQVAKKYSVVRKTLERRHKGLCHSRKEAASMFRKKLSTPQEQVLLADIRRLNNRGLPPKPKIVRKMASRICGDYIGKHWVDRFCARYPDVVRSVKLDPIDRKRQLAENPEYIEQWFKVVGAHLPVVLNCTLLTNVLSKLEEVIDKKRIEPENIYNFDEKGFLIGRIHSDKRIVTTDAFDSNQLL